MNPKPFTYDHFVQSIQSEEMLLYYIDEAVAIYCVLTGRPVGPRPASPKDYSPEYAEAFEAANLAVFKVYRKIGSYDPSKGVFKKYLDKALSNAIKDILEENGRGNLPSLEDEGVEPDTEASDRDRREREHKDKALETMIRYIDTLPEMKRAAIYASAFGQILRPDLEGYGRNYADILARIYNTSALYIRKLANDGKKAAIAEARRQGFSERSMAGVSMGYLQVVRPEESIEDRVLRAISELDEYRQFIFLRHLAGFGK